MSKITVTRISNLRLHCCHSYGSERLVWWIECILGVTPFFLEPRMACDYARTHYWGPLS